MSSAVTSAAVARKKSPEAGPPLRQTRPPWVRGALSAALRALAAARLSEEEEGEEGDAAAGFPSPELSAAALAAAPPSAPPAASRSKSVVFPLPEGPTIATNSPGQTRPLHGCRMRLRSPVAALKTSTETECHERSVGKRAARAGEGEGLEEGGGAQRVGQ